MNSLAIIPTNCIRGAANLLRSRLSDAPWRSLAEAALGSDDFAWLKRRASWAEKDKLGEPSADVGLLFLALFAEAVRRDGGEGDRGMWNAIRNVVPESLRVGVHTRRTGN